MFNFYVVLAGDYKVTDAVTDNTCRCKFKAHHYKQKVEKMKDIAKTWVLRGKQFEVFRRKKEQKYFFDLSKTPVGHQDLGAIN